ncbi:Mnd1 protein [Saccharomycopsis crataegensis]|uniref:Meiotic nuclear division protein 1 n=1 Tax=Saccharomycopsis crataegensis TaxID=43959 RepID=A0AAV5QEF5_9ASCO|nr:Mnd1 protein [Saccharomycopsis crataegensis]
MAVKKATAEEKRDKLLQFFTDDFSFYSIKEIETTAAKKTGISSMQIKDVLQQLLDEDLVKFDKCGSMNLYWCFQYDSTKNMIVKHRRLLENIREAEDDKRQIVSAINVARKEREENISNDKDGANNITRISLQREIKELKQEHQELLSRVRELQLNDPARIEQMQSSLIKTQLESERYTDNVDSLVGYLARENGINSSDLRRELGIPDYD